MLQDEPNQTQNIYTIWVKKDGQNGPIPQFFEIFSKKTLFWK